MIDQSWRNEFGDQAETRLNAVIEHAKTFFQHASLKTKFALDVLPVQNHPNSVLADVPDIL